jgi:hypothetical protein
MSLRVPPAARTAVSTYNHLGEPIFLAWEQLGGIDIGLRHVDLVARSTAPSIMRIASPRERGWLSQNRHYTHNRPITHLVERSSLGSTLVNVKGKSGLLPSNCQLVEACNNLTPQL